MSRKQDAMSEVAGQVLDQAQGLATRVAGISTDLGTLQQAGVGTVLSASAGPHVCIASLRSSGMAEQHRRYYL